jgi:hypothetical protein
MTYTWELVCLTGTNPLPRTIFDPFQKGKFSDAFEAARNWLRISDCRGLTARLARNRCLEILVWFYS